MDGHNSLGDVFRFLQLRPAKPVSDVDTIPLASTDLAGALSEADSVDARLALADEALANDTVTVRSVGDLQLGEELLAALTETQSRADATTADLIGEIGDVESEELGADRIRLSNTLLAATFGTQGAGLDLPVLEDVYRVYALVAEVVAGEATDSPLEQYMSRRLLAPIVLARRDREGRAEVTIAAGGRTQAESMARAVPGLGSGDGRLTLPPHAAAIEELARLDHGGNIVQPTSSGVAGDEVPFTLARDARDQLSEHTREVLRQHRIDLDSTPVHAAVMLLSGVAGQATARSANGPDPAVGGASGGVVSAAIEAPLPKPVIRPAGIAQLLVVKQQIKRYEAAEIAHVE
ncbi:MAG: hypothetical protein ACREVB_00015, partial [Burkholderiales bacterium]